jgi:molybdopterin-guanine dinucleotide biosynthesis protein A
MESKSASIIVLSGGTSSRFGSDKSAAILGHQELIHHVLAGIPQEFEIIVVGPDPLFSDVSYTCLQENPIGGGPVAGIAAALEICNSDVIGVLATDMPFAVSHMVHLLSAMSSHDDAVMYVDSKGYRQPLAAIYRREGLEIALAKLGAVHGQSMRALMSHLKINEIHMSPEVEKAMIDVDTPHDLVIAMEYLRSL